MTAAIATGPIPEIDLAAFLRGSTPGRRRAGAVVDAACREVGFLVIRNHGVSPKVVDDTWDAARAFFDLPLADKLAIDAAGGPRGYFPLAAEALARTRGAGAAADPKEAFSSGPLAPPAGHFPMAEFEFFYGPNRWPPALPEFRDAWIACYRAMEDLGARIMQLLAVALGLPDDWFARFHTHHLGALRALNYPPLEPTGAAATQRAGAHSDYGTVTILCPDPEVGGLEIRLPGGRWVAAPSVADGFIVNLGDLMALWTGGRWVSTLHRVVVPGDQAHLRRQSLAFFMNPNYDAAIALPDSPSGAQTGGVIAGTYLVDKFRAATGAVRGG